MAQITVSSFKAQTRAATQPNNDHPKKRFKAKIAPVLARRLLKSNSKRQKVKEAEDTNEDGKKETHCFYFSRIQLWVRPMRGMPR